jgi:sugar phosphate permease
VPEDDSHKAAQIQTGLRRRWLYLMPVVFVTYSLAYLGRSNFGFGAAAGLAKSLNITESRAAFLGSVFFLGYFLFQIPAAAYAIRRSATRLVFFALISWGIFSGLTGIIHNYWLLVVDRLLLGVAESLIFPSMLILLANWFTRSERSRANAVLILSGSRWRETGRHRLIGFPMRALSIWLRRLRWNSLGCPSMRIFARRCACRVCWCCASSTFAGASAFMAS